MSRKSPEQVRRKSLARITQIQREIRQLDFVCSGTLVKRRKVCGKPGCRCARDRQARHGPYYEWGYMEGGRQVHRMVSHEQATLLRKAIANYRAVRRLLRRWQVETSRIMEAETRPNR